MSRKQRKQSSVKNIKAVDVITRAQDFKDAVDDHVEAVIALANEMEGLRAQQKGAVEADAYLDSMRDAVAAEYAAKVQALDAKCRLWRQRGEIAEALVKKLSAEAGDK